MWKRCKCYVRRLNLVLQDEYISESLEQAWEVCSTYSLPSLFVPVADIANQLGHFYPLILSWPHHPSQCNAPSRLLMSRDGSQNETHLLFWAQNSRSLCFNLIEGSQGWTWRERVREGGINNLYGECCVTPYLENKTWRLKEIPVT